MANHATFHYRTLEALEAEAGAMGLDIRFEREIRDLAAPVRVDRWVSPNALAIHPMEGCDSEPDGSPGPLTRRRYARFAAGGAGLLWFEACAVVAEGRANPHQLWLHPGSAGSFAAMLAEARAAARDAHGMEHCPLMVLQLTHSGRYSRPREGASRPIPVRHDPNLDPPAGVPPDAELLSDEDIEALEDQYVAAARLAREAGFDGVDIKSCHGYLCAELLAARHRAGRYGGSYEGRTRFLKDVVARIREAVPDLLLAVRLNVFDGIPGGFGVAARGDGRSPDLTEPKRLVRDLRGLGVSLVNVTAGNPYYNPHIGRPFDRPIEAAYMPDEHPLQGVARLFGLARSIQRAVPEVACVGTGYSWLRQYLGYAGEANLRNGWTRFVGVGREAFAHPDFAAELLREGRLRPEKVCITCSSCTQLMRDGAVAGCVPRDKPVYSPVFAEGRRQRPGAQRAPHPVRDHI